MMKKRPLQDIVTKTPRDRRMPLHDSNDFSQKTARPPSRPSVEKPSPKERPIGSDEKTERKPEQAKEKMQDDVRPVAITKPDSRQGREVRRRSSAADTDDQAEERQTHVSPRKSRADVFSDSHFLRPKRGRPWFAIAAGIAVLILGGAFLLTLQFAGAKVVVFPKVEKDVFIDGRFFARADKLPGELQYQSMTLERVVSREVRAESQEEVEERARGEIIIFNDFSPESQRLIKNTRFETADGKIYRIEESIEVPGQTEDANGKTIPGQIEIEAIADSPGEEYNIDSAEFTIPGFAGTPRFDGFYARTKSPIQGGFVGTRLSVDDDQLARVRSDLQEELRKELKAAALSPSEIPDDLYLFESGLFYEFSEQPRQQVDDNTVEIREKGKVTGLLFSKAAFAQHLAANTVAGYDGNDVMLANPESLSITISPVEGEATASSSPLYSLAITGTETFVWTFDENALKNDLAGRQEQAISTVLTGYPGIDHVDVSFRPFWKKTFPESSDEIEIVVEREDA